MHSNKHVAGIFVDELKFTKLAVCSETGDVENICKENNFNYINYENSPISNKWNAGCLWFKDKDIDFLLCLGSDDFINKKLLEAYVVEMKSKSDFIGILDCFFLDKTTNRLVYWAGYNTDRKGETIGMARCLSKKILNKLKFTLWKENIHSSLDYSLNCKLMKIKHKKSTLKLIDCGGFAVDVKTGFNVTPFAIYHNSTLVDESYFYECIPIFNP